MSSRYSQYFAWKAPVECFPPSDNHWCPGETYWEHSFFPVKLPQVSWGCDVSISEAFGMLGMMLKDYGSESRRHLKWTPISRISTIVAQGDPLQIRLFTGFEIIQNITLSWVTKWPFPLFFVFSVLHTAMTSILGASQLDPLDTRCEPGQANVQGLHHVLWPSITASNKHFSSKTK